MDNVVFVPRFLSTLSLRRATRAEIHANSQQEFLSTLSLRRATAHTAKNTSIAGHFYPRSPCGERPAELTTLVNKLFISIHALLAESDSVKSTPEEAKRYFYPRSPCGERQRAEIHANSQQEFLSTLSLRRATIYQERQGEFYAHFYPRSPCGERLTTTITICIASKFLSTLSLRRATSKLSGDNGKIKISIHALLAESDIN